MSDKLKIDKNAEYVSIGIDHPAAAAIKQDRELKKQEKKLSKQISYIAKKIGCEESRHPKQEAIILGGDDGKVYGGLEFLISSLEFLLKQGEEDGENT